MLKGEKKPARFERKPQFASMSEIELLNAYAHFKKAVREALSKGVIDKYSAYTRWIEEIKEIARAKNIYHKLDDHVYNLLQEEKLVRWRC